MTIKHRVYSFDLEVMISEIKQVVQRNDEINELSLHKWANKIYRDKTEAIALALEDFRFDEDYLRNPTKKEDLSYFLPWFLVVWASFLTPLQSISKPFDLKILLKTLDWPESEINALLWGRPLRHMILDIDLRNTLIGIDQHGGWLSKDSQRRIIEKLRASIKKVTSPSKTLVDDYVKNVISAKQLNDEAGKSKKFRNITANQMLPVYSEAIKMLEIAIERDNELLVILD